jgi:small subunit ribosomal protein S1
MPSVELLTLIALAVGLPLTAVLLAVALLVYPQARLLLGDVLKLFWFAGSWVRKAAIASEVEGSLNSFVNSYNHEASDLVLPQCRVEWVTADNHAQTVLPGTVVVRVSLDRDHDRNFYAATTTFVAHSFLPRAKAFLTKATSRGVDLVMVHGILSEARRAALRIFNEEFVDESPDVQKAYYALEDIEQEGLLKRVLFRELHYLGENLGDRAPRPEHATEADKFLDWLHRLAVRDPGELSQLHFSGREMKVGVILVARDETFLQHGIDPYLRRALSYSTQGFQSLYLLSRGAKRGAVVKRIARELESLGGFEILAKRLDIRVGDPHSNEIITCVPLKVDAVALIQTAWNRLAKAKTSGERVQGTVLFVSRTQVEIEVYGIEATLGQDTMSGMTLPDATRYFQPGDELTLEVIAIDADRGELILSNVGTESDPKQVVDAFASAADQVVKASVVRFSARDGFEIGLQVALEGTTTPGWIPRSKARCGRFVTLSENFPVGSAVDVKVHRFGSEHNNWLCELVGLPDPWVRASEYTVGGTYNVTVREIGERHVVCELVNGVEAVVYQDEIAWGTDADRKTAIDSLQPGQAAPAILLDIEPEKRFARLSFKRVVQSKAHLYFQSVRDQVITARVVEVHDNRARLAVDDQDHELVLPISEVVWGYCDALERIVQVGTEVRVVPFDYNPASDSIVVSAKRARPNDFDALREQLNEGTTLEAEVIAIGRDQVYVNSVLDGRPAAGYVHKSQVSNLIFVTPDEMSQVMPIGSKHSFVVRRRDDLNRVVELSRRAWLQQSFLSLEYGQAYRGPLHTLPDGRRLFSSNELEAFAGRPSRGGGKAINDVEVTIARKGANPRETEISLEHEKQKRFGRR